MSVCSREYNVTITHDALDLTVQKHAIRRSTCTLLVTSLRTCSNLFIMKHKRAVGILLEYFLVTKLGQGYIFTGICHSVNRGRAWQGVCLAKGVGVRGMHTHPPLRDTAGQCAGGKHPTGILYNFIL